MSNLTENVANNVANEKVQDYVKKSHNVKENEPKSEKTTQDVQKNCLSLTEKWKNGELQGGWYFVEFENGSILPVFYCGFNRGFEFNWDWKISKVLSRCSYEEFDNVIKCYLSAHEKADRLEKENQKLKELLKECKPYVIRNVVFTTINKGEEADLERNILLTKIDEVLK